VLLESGTRDEAEQILGISKEEEVQETHGM